jgi:hypothetical protein
VRPTRGQEHATAGAADSVYRAETEPVSGLPASRLGEESALLIQALHAMAKGRLETAAYWLDRHQRQFSSDGQLTRERQRIRRQLRQQSLRKKGSAP